MRHAILPGRSIDRVSNVSAMNPPGVTWRTHLSLALLGLVYVFSYIDRQVIAVLIQPIKQEFGVSDTLMGLLTGLAFGLLYAAMGVPMGRLADRGNRRAIVAVCCALWSLATMACGLAGQFWQLLLARMSVAIGEAGGMAPSISLVSDLYPKHRRSLAISLFMMGPHLGVLIGLAVGGWVAQQYGWRAAFLVFGAPGIALGLLVWLCVPEPRRGGFETAAPAAPAAQESLGAQMLRLLAQPAFRHLAVGCGIAGIAGYGYGIWTPSFLVRTHGLSIAHAGLMFGVASGLGAISGALFSGWICDRLTQRDPRWQIGLPMLGLLLCVPAALAFLLWPAGDYWLLAGLKVPHAMVFAMLFGFLASWWPSLAYSATSQMVAAGERAVAAAVLNLFITLLGAGAGPLVTGLLSDLLTPQYGEQALRWSLVSVSCLFLLTVVFFAWAVQPYRRRISALAAAA
jgi:MFS family permease